MRPLSDIIIAVMECQPATEEELRLALVAVCHIDVTQWQMLDDIIEAISHQKPLPLLMIKAAIHCGTLKSLHAAKKKTPAEFLGPKHTPGTPEHDANVKFAKEILSAMGVPLNTSSQS